MYAVEIPLRTDRERTNGEHRHYRLFPPMEVHDDWDDRAAVTLVEYVIVSYSSVIKPETFIFPADVTGEITNYGELPGSFQGGRGFELALENAGYEVVSRLEGAQLSLAQGLAVLAARVEQMTRSIIEATKAMDGVIDAEIVDELAIEGPQ